MPSYPIKIERLTGESNDPFADLTDTWEVIAEPFAIVEPLSGKELIEAEQTTSNHTHKVKFRWGHSVSDLNTKDRLRFRGRRFELTSVVNVGERNEWFECMAVESL